MQALEKSRNGVKEFPFYGNLMKPRGENQGSGSTAGDLISRSTTHESLRKFHVFPQHNFSTFNAQCMQIHAA
jgi:hypothetical protein